MKAIYLTDLAQQYFPKSSARSAVAQLRRWIVLNEDLQQRLTELHFHKGQRSLTPCSTKRYVISLENQVNNITAIPGIGFRCRGLLYIIG